MGLHYIEARGKRQKVDTENQAFNLERTEAFVFILPVGSSKPLRLTCSETKSGIATLKISTKLLLREVTHQTRQLY